MRLSWLMIVFCLASCDRDESKQIRTAAKAASSEDATAEVSGPTPLPGRTVTTIPQSQLGWDGKTFGETKTLYVIPVE